ncbi:MAG: hypothetical protein AB7I50_10985 [Vicinamibacterales bacterium]
MNTADIRLALWIRGTRLLVSLDEFVDADVRERAAIDANRWIKTLRLARIDGVSLRDRFHHRGDSLWWFTELYLHKQARVVRWLETLRALDRCLSAYGPDRVRIETAPADVAIVLDAVAGRRRIAGPPNRSQRLAALDARLRQDARALFYTWTARASRWRPAHSRHTGGARVAAFVHSAFWRSAAGAKANRPSSPTAQGEEGYVGAVLRTLDSQLGPGELRLVGVGPRVNFRARSWWHGVSARDFDSTLPMTPIEALADTRAIRASLEVWNRRQADERALLSSQDIRDAASFDGYDLWPLVAHELRGVVRLQWPWSARAMDEAGAALDALQPSCVVTYAEAGGWGRAILIEARRRGMRTAGLQHGFIYRHWLNYLHEPDEMQPSPAAPSDAGFPKPTRTLLYDRYAEEHLLTAGHFSPADLEVTGNPRLADLVASAEALDDDERASVRASIGAAPEDHVVVVAAKYTQIRRVFRRLCEAVATRRTIRLVVKCHPAETPDPYERDAAGLSGIVVAPASASLARLLAVASGLVTVNSTVALDALVLGVPTLVIDLPNNLSPFVDAGVMVGAHSPDDIDSGVARLVEPGPAREAILGRRSGFLTRFGMEADRNAAARTAAVIAALAQAESSGR